MAELRDQSELERTLTKDDVKQVGIVKTDDVSHDTEYQEFLRLNETFQGARLSKLHHKTDWHVLPPLFAVYCLTYIDRANIGNARLFGAQTDLGLSGTEWNIGLSLLFITYAIGSPIANIFVKIYSTKWVLPVLCIGCGLTIIGAGCSSNEAAWYALRLLLGLFEGGIYSACAYSLTTWYSPGVLASRTAFFYLGGTSSGGISGLLAYGIGQLDGKWGYRGWRFIYVIEGLVSFVLGVFAFYWIQGDPEKRHRWLTEDEQRFIILRNKFGYGADKSGNKLLGFTWSDFFSAAKSPHVWFLGVANFSFCVALYAFSFTLPTIVRNMGFTAARAQALSAPPYFIACFFIVLNGLLTDKFRQRTLATIVPATVGFVGMIICMTTAEHKNLVPLTYIGCVLVASGLYCLTPTVSSWLALNVAGQTKRAAALSMGVIFTQLGGVLGSNIYLANEAPRYPTGFGVSIACVFTGCVVTPMIYWYYLGQVNKKRDLMSEEEIRMMYSAEELEGMGDRSPFYRYER